MHVTCTSISVRALLPRLTPLVGGGLESAARRLTDGMWRPPCSPPRITRACHIGRRCPRPHRAPRASRGAGGTRAGEAPRPRARGAARGGPRRSACGEAAGAQKAPRWSRASRSYFSAVLDCFVHISVHVGNHLFTPVCYTRYACTVSSFGARRRQRGRRSTDLHYALNKVPLRPTTPWTTRATDPHPPTHGHVRRVATREAVQSRFRLS